MKIPIFKLSEPWGEIIYWFSLTRLLLWATGILARHFIAPINSNFHWWLTPYKSLSMWGSWDSGWYLPLAQHGYSSVSSLNPLTLGQNNTVFFPLYPLLIKALSYFFGYFGAGIVVSNLALIIGVFGLYKLILLDYEKEVALMSIITVMIFPFSFFFSSILTESVFFCLSIWSIYLFKVNRRNASLICAFLLALSRPTGILVAIPLAVLSLKDKKYALAIKSVLAPALGLLLYMSYLYSLSKNPFIFIETQQAWGRSLSFPPFTIFSALINGGYADKFGGVVAVLSLMVLYKYREKLSLEIILYSLTALTLPLFSGIASFARYSLGAIGLFVALSFAMNNPKTKESLMIIFMSLNIILFTLWTSGFTFII